MLRIACRCVLLAVAAAVAFPGGPAAVRAGERPGTGKARVEPAYHAPCNLFDIDETVSFPVVVTGVAPEANGEVVVDVKDYFGKPVRFWQIPFKADGKGRAETVAELGKPGPGYYSLSFRAFEANAFPGPSASASFGVAPFVQRTSAAARDNHRFGLKLYAQNLKRGKWPKEARWDLKEVVDATCRLGLQWTRHIHSVPDNQDNPGNIGSAELAADFPMNVVYKIERFPAELYDAEKYGPLDEWEKKFGKGGWTLKTLPRKDDYQKWLAEGLAKLPADQRVFEIWNEPWDKMSPEDFAALCQWIAEVVRRDRPDAKLGPNLYGNTSKYQYDNRFIDAGGMKGMDLVALHPYASSEDRAWLREYRDWISERAGRPIEVIVTEFGSHSTPQGPSKRSELEQSQRVVRQALALYAEDVKILLPHWMGQREQNPTYIEDWFGFFRLNSQPKPVLLAYANAAARVDGGVYLGDLWYGPGIDAMLFEQDGVRTLALFTRGETKKLDLFLDADRVRRYQTDGQFVDLRLDGKTKTLKGVTLGPDPLYFRGVGPELAKQASKELRPDRWPEEAEPKPITRVAKRVADPKALAFDGTFAGWEPLTALAMSNPKVAGDDASGTAYLGWDEKFLYVGLKMRDNEVINRQPRAKLYRQDSLELFLSVEPREGDAGYGPNDHQYFITPASGEGKPIFGILRDRAMGVVEDVRGGSFFGGTIPQGWAVQAAVPWPAGFAAKPGAVAAVELKVNDADSSHERFSLESPDQPRVQVENPSSWSRLELGR